jgi:hypothetical protein
MTALMLELFKVAATYGIPAVVKLLEDWKLDRDPTPEEIRARAATLPKPKEF